MQINAMLHTAYLALFSKGWRRTGRGWLNPQPGARLLPKADDIMKG